MQDHDASFTPRRRRMMALSAAGIFLGSAGLNLVEAAIPGGPPLSVIPGLCALVFALLLWLFGERLPYAALFCLGPIGIALVALALATTAGPGDGAILYAWPVLWEAYFFGRRGVIVIVACVALFHGLAVLHLPAGESYFDRWLDVVASAALVATVVELLANRNRKLVEELVNEARLDNLTGLLNRRGFTERAAAELARSSREESWLGVASFDLDHFKEINDRYGHAVGDRVLARIARLVEGEMRESDVLARMGGEEFVALLPGDRAKDATAVAERVRGSLEALDDPRLPSVTISAGVVSALAPADLDALLRDADRALYEAKASGRNRTVTRVDEPIAS